MKPRFGSAALVRALERARETYGGNAASSKRNLIRAAARTRCRSARELVRLHEALCFLRAYPDDAGVLADVETVLSAFAARPDVRRFRAALADTGIAGTDLHDRFFWFTAVWLAQRWPERLAIDWPAFENQKDLTPLLRLLVPAAESAAMDDVERPPRRWIELWCGAGETDAAFLVHRFAALRADAFTVELLFERLDPPMVLRSGTLHAGDRRHGRRATAAGPGARARARDTASPPPPSRTTARVPGLAVAFRERPFERARPDLRRESRRPPRGVHAVPARQARELLDLARAAMVTRNRDLDSFEHADLDDVRLVDCGDGLQFATFGLVPERRALLDVIYGYLTLQSGVPTGYVLSTALFESAFVAYNVFETFRRAAAATTYARVLGMVRALFGATTFAIDPYQLGHHNAEGQKSGAWWFYYKLGFRPVDATVQARVRAELRHLRADPRHRSSRSTLHALAASPLFLHAGRARADVLGQVTLANVSLHVSRALAAHGSDREATLDAAVVGAARLLGVGAPRAGDGARRLAWERWAPLVFVLPGVAQWPGSDRAALARVVDAKGGRRESDFVHRFDAHTRLRRAVLQLARRPPP
jgi:hypothetical protein